MQSLKRYTRSPRYKRGRLREIWGNDVDKTRDKLEGAERYEKQSQKKAKGTGMKQANINVGKSKQNDDHARKRIKTKEDLDEE